MPGPTRRKCRACGKSVSLYEYMNNGPEIQGSETNAHFPVFTYKFQISGQMLCKYF